MCSYSTCEYKKVKNWLSFIENIHYSLSPLHVDSALLMCVLHPKLEFGMPSTGMVYCCRFTHRLHCADSLHWWTVFGIVNISFVDPWKHAWRRRRTWGWSLQQRLGTSRLKLFLKLFCAGINSFVSLASSERCGGPPARTLLYTAKGVYLFSSSEVCLWNYSQETEIRVAYRIKFRTLNKLLGNVLFRTAR